VRTRKAGADRHIDLHLVVPRDTPVEEAHDLCDQLEAQIDEILPGTNVLIHLEPGDPPERHESK
jgi:divalent metal cation (Fe/Co/Zn/Cd) transporter